MILVQAALGAGVAASWVYWILCLDSMRRFFRPTERHSGPLPPISVLKPLSGEEPYLRENLSGFCRQDYAEYEVVAGALDAEDSALPAAREIRATCGRAPVTVVEGAPDTGLNRKAATLAALRRRARFQILAASDSDIRVGPDYLSAIGSEFLDGHVGLVTCPYRGAAASGPASRLEALGIALDFMPSVFLAQRFGGVRFAFGSTLAIRADLLDALGGFSALSERLADDYHLARSVREAGYRVALSPFMVETVLGRQSFRASWTRRLRWARTTRALHPWGHFGLVVTHGLALSVLLCLAAGFAAWSLCVLIATLILRGAVSTQFGALLGDREPIRSLHLIPVSDLAAFALWAASFAGRTVAWRGRRFRLTEGDRLTPVDGA